MWDSLDTLCHGKLGVESKLFGNPEQKKTDTGSLIHIGQRDGLPIFCYGPSSSGLFTAFIFICLFILYIYIKFHFKQVLLFKDEK